MWTLLEYLPFFFGAWVCGFNFYLDCVRDRLAHRRAYKLHRMSATPLLGSFILAWFAAWHFHEPVWFWLSVAIATLDTGGLHCLLGMIVWFEVIHLRLRGKTEPNIADEDAHG